MKKNSPIISTHSDKQKFLWIQNAKCASTSIFWALLEYTDLAESDRSILSGELEALTKDPFRFIKEDAENREEIKHFISDKNWKDLKEKEADLRGFRGIWEHKYPREDPDYFNGYFKFLFVRNPWARLVSYFHGGWPANKLYKPHKKVFNEEFGVSMPTEDDFRDYILKITSSDGINSDRHYFVQSNNLPLEDMDFIGKVENFKNDFNFVCQKIGIPKETHLHINKSTHANYTAYYNDETREIVAEKYAKDIEIFGYKFNE